MTPGRHKVREWLGNLTDSVCFFAVAVMCVFIAFWLSFHIGDLYRIGGDEGYEALKGSLYGHGFRLYKEIWDDQPPLYTWLLALGFKSFGTFMPVARLVASGFGILLFVATFAVTRMSAGALAGWLACVVLMLSPETLQLSLSVMQEVPTMSLALCSVWTAWLWKQNDKTVWLILSGVLMGLALQMKLTAAIVIPSLLLDLAMAAFGKYRLGWAGAMWCGRVIATWIGSLSLVFFGIAACFPGWGLDLLWFTHAAASVGAGVRGSGVLRLSYFARAVPMLLGAVMFLFVTIISRQRKNFLFYYAFLLTVCVIHVFHRPFWDYYMFHFDLAMALPAGIVMSMFFKGAGLQGKEPQVVDYRRKVASLCGYAVLVFVLVVGGGPVLYQSCMTLQNSERISENPLPAVVRECKNTAGQLFTIAPLEGFYSGLPVVPFLAVLSPVRYWSGQISDAKILTMLKRIRPAYLLLPSNYLAKPGWAVFVDEGYAHVSVVRGEVFYKAKSLLGQKSDFSPHVMNAD